MLAPAHAAGAGDFRRLVVVGDSLSAGYQNFSLFDSDSLTAVPPGGQKHGYAALVARQAGAGLALPLISFPGVPPALTLMPGGQIVRGSATGTRINPAVQAYNLSVPGFTVSDALAHAVPGDPVNNPVDAMTGLVLATPGNVVRGCGPIPTRFVPWLKLPSALVVSQVVCAAALRPTTILVSLGSNDALQSLLFGTPPTNPAVFAAKYSAVLGVLAATGAKIVVSNIPDVTVVPFLVPVPAFRSACPAAVLPATISDADYVVPNLLDATEPAVDVCTNYAVRSRALVAQAGAAVTAYNAAIARRARIVGAVVVDFNGLLARIARDGYRVGNRVLTTAFLGGLFSLDGIHPTNTGYAILANQTIAAMNARWRTRIPLVSVDQVAATDPLILPAL